MKMIDEKGKLFGVINVIDLCVVLVLVLMVVGGVKLFGNRWAKVKPNGDVYVQLEVADVRQATIDGLVDGDELNYYDENVLFGTIESKEIKPFVDNIQTDNKLVPMEVPGKYVVTLKMKCPAYITEDVVVINGKHTRIGNQFTLKNRKVSIQGVALKVDIIEQ
ncbi:MAG: DUF4330 domain-containing protein [Tissierellales bacterium]|jgi:hypothetical protein|nr:DUF4330 domain-containing protein [Tissierellales bacterium]